VLYVISLLMQHHMQEEDFLFFGAEVCGKLSETAVEGVKILFYSLK
jgi:hypothetical protein